jgi:hypothetical protein
LLRNAENLFKKILKYTKKLTYEAGVRAAFTEKILETKPVVTDSEKRSRDGNPSVCKLSVVGRVLLGRAENCWQISWRRHGMLVARLRSIKARRFNEKYNAITARDGPDRRLFEESV